MSMNASRNHVRMEELVWMELMSTVALVFLDTLDLTVKQVITVNLIRLFKSPMIKYIIIRGRNIVDIFEEIIFVSKI